MSAPKYNFIIDQGSDFLKTITLSSDGAAWNLTDYSVRGQLRSSIPSSTVSATFTGTITSAMEGKFTIGLPYTATATMTPGIYYYDIELYNGSSVIRILQGTATVSPEVTR